MKFFRKTESAGQVKKFRGGFEGSVALAKHLVAMGVPASEATVLASGTGPRRYTFGDQVFEITETGRGYELRISNRSESGSE